MHADRRQFLVADGGSLVDDGFPLLPTVDSPLVCAASISGRPSSVVAHRANQTFRDCFQPWTFGPGW